MTRQEANEEAKKLAEWEMKERDRLWEEAEKAGKLPMGLDGDKRVFYDLNEKVKKRLAEINSQIEE